ncbi:MAG: (d)CMP kinase [Thermodesulfobacteriota bacterium]|nr:(d)CMP kinase [Thermodesulfobacteriota bacterium]
MVVAVDGPAGAGKSSVCRELARRLGFAYLDTGAMYRATAWAVLQSGRQEASSEELAEVLKDFPLEFDIQDGSLRILWEGKDVAEDQLRTPQVTASASRISQQKPVRDLLVHWQRRLAAQRDVVAEGRDMTTVVFPDASIKVFLTADLTARVRRRLGDYRKMGLDPDPDKLADEIRTRDEADAGRALAPLKPAPGAWVVDTSDLTFEEVVELLSQRVGSRRSVSSGSSFSL